MAKLKIRRKVPERFADQFGAHLMELRPFLDTSTPGRFLLLKDYVEKLCSPEELQLLLKLRESLAWDYSQISSKFREFAQDSRDPREFKELIEDLFELVSRFSEQYVKFCLSKLVSCSELKLGASEFSSRIVTGHVAGLKGMHFTLDLSELELAMERFNFMMRSLCLFLRECYCYHGTPYYYRFIELEIPPLIRGALISKSKTATD